MAVTLRRTASSQVIPASCPAGATVGDMVWIAGDKVSGIHHVDLCDIDVAHKRPVGMLTVKQSATSCTVQVRGPIDGIYTGLTPGRPMFLGIGTGARLVQLSPGRPSSGKRWHQIAGWSWGSEVINLSILEPIILIPL